MVDFVIAFGGEIYEYRLGQKNKARDECSTARSEPFIPRERSSRKDLVGELRGTHLLGINIGR